MAVGIFDMHTDPLSALAQLDIANISTANEMLFMSSNNQDKGPTRRIKI